MYYRLKVPYPQKDDAKALGAKWNFQEKIWYFEGEELPAGLKRWYHERQTEREPIVDLVVSGESPIRIETAPDSDLRGEYTGAGVDRYRTVSQVNNMISRRFEETEEFLYILVKGEVTNYSGHNGNHYYFDIKDGNSQLTCRLWEATARRILHFKLEKGQLVGIAGTLEYYGKTGTAQLIVSDIRNLGDGEANLALMQLKKRLQDEGLFDPEHKKPLPGHPKTVGIITSKNGQAIKDICQKAAERDPYVQLLLYHVNVQGKYAVSTIVRGIRFMDRMNCDVILVGRGGGSDEELMVYNAEEIARAVFEAKTPIISAVGHEGHWTLIDHVADLRVSTPTSAAEHAIPDVMKDVKRLGELTAGMKGNLRYQLDRRKAFLKLQMATLERYHPERRLKEQKGRLTASRELLQRNMEEILREHSQELELKRDVLKRAMAGILQARQQRYMIAVANLNGLSPTSKLVKGFGYITVKDQPLYSVRQAQKGDTLRIRIHDGEIGAAVTEVEEKEGRA